VTGAIKNPAPAEADKAGGASARFLRPLETVLSRGARVFFVFGDEDEERWDQFEQARSATLGDLLDRAGGQVEVKMVSGTIANIQDVSAQDEIIELVAGWVTAS
jgi:hypothetical protein